MRSHKVCFNGDIRKLSYGYPVLSAAVTSHNIICGVRFFMIIIINICVCVCVCVCSLLIFQRNKNRNQTYFSFYQLTFMPFVCGISDLLLLLLLL